MDSTQRAIVNTLSQHIRSVLNIALSLYATRIVMDSLGQSDFGIYCLIAGIVSMLGFIQNAMVVSTQRFLSFSYGKEDMDDAKTIFANSMFLQIAMGVMVIVVIGALAPVIMHKLNIPGDRIAAAGWVYAIVLATVGTTFVIAPFRALFIARENIVYISIIDVVDGLLKLGLAFTIYYTTMDRLIYYSLILLFIQLFHLLALAVYANIHYQDATWLPDKKRIRWGFIQKMGGFAGWTLYGTACTVGRIQGMSIILNLFYGTLMNAAYGIAQQVGSGIQFVAQAVVNAMSPQVTKEEAAGHREKMLFKARMTSVYASLLMVVVAVPLILLMPQILSIWLKSEVPDHSVLLCRMMLVAAIVDQITIGLGIANQAIGKIRNYTLTVFTIKGLTIPAAYICLSKGMDITYVAGIYVILEFVSALARIPFGLKWRR